MAQEAARNYTFGTRIVPSESLKTVKATLVEIEKRSNPKAFGMILVTQPTGEALPFNTYLINPDIVKTWLNPEIGIDQLMKQSKKPDVRNGEMKLIYNANEVSVRNIISKASFNSTGVSELWWTEEKSGNEFFVSTDLWHKITKER